MKMKYYFVKTVAAVLLIGITMGTAACTGQFEEYNTDPNRATDEDLGKDMLSLGGMFPTMMVDIIPTSDTGANDYQRAQNLTGDIFSGYMAGTNNWNGCSNNNTYNLEFDNWNDVGFDVAYRVMGAYMEIKKQVAETGQTDALAVANILKVMAMHRICDNYGPIPYSKMSEGNIGMAYDSQEDVYMAFFKELNEAIAELSAFVNNSPGARPLSKYDLIFGGEYKQWIRFANSLKLRLAMRIVYVKPELAKKYAEEAVANPYGVMASNADNAVLKSGLGFSVFHPLHVIWSSYNDTRMGASMESILNGYNDPRMPKYFLPSAKESKYIGVRNGSDKMNMYGVEYYRNYASAPNVNPNTPIVWMTAAEIYFLRAEGALRGWAMQETAAALYNKGVQTSFEQYGVADKYAAYIANSEAKPANYSGLYANFFDPAPAVSTITIAWNEEADFETSLERIMTQKWLAMFPEGQEAWSEFRRTGYPKLFPVVKNNSKDISTEKQIRRITFPKKQRSSNGAEVTKAEALLGGPDSGATQLWWDKKN